MTDLGNDERLAEPDVFRRPGASRPRPGALRDLDILAVIALGGGLGSLARYGVERLAPARVDAFPWATLTVNLVGCLAIGVLMVFVTDVWESGRYARPFLGIGVLGGFTTFSTLALDLRNLGASEEWLLAFTYLASTVIGGLLAVGVGMTVTRWATR